MKPTPIPKDGWTEEDIGKDVIIKMPHGTLVHDKIVFINNYDGTQLIGPATELGGITARVAWVIPIIEAHDAMLMSMDDDTDDEGGV